MHRQQVSNSRPLEIYSQPINRLPERRIQLCRYLFFQMVVLARVIIGSDQVSLTARGITQLVRLLGSREENIVILCGKYACLLLRTWTCTHSVVF